MQSLSKYNQVIKYLLRAVDLLSKYAGVIPLKNKRGINIVNTSQKEENQIKNRLISVVNFTIIFLRSF